MNFIARNSSLLDTLKKVLLYASVVAIVYVLTFLTHSPDYDLWARLAVGSIFVQTGSVLHHDIFSYVPTKAHWIDHEWGSGVIFYSAVKLFGGSGIFILKAVLILMILLLIIRITTMKQNGKSPGVVYLMLLAFALFPGFAAVIRCQMFTYLFFTLWLYLLEVIRTTGNRKYLWVFPVTMVIWANLHGGFIVGIGLVAMYAIGEFLNRKNPKQFILLLLIVVLVTLLNPYGLEYWKYIIDASLMPRPTIPEWHPIRLDGPFQMIMGLKVHYLSGFLVIVLLTLAVVAKRIINKEKQDWTRMVLGGVLLYIGIRHQRHVVFFIIAASALYYNEFVKLFDPVKKSIGKKLSGKSKKLLTTAKNYSGYVLLFVIVLRITPFLGFNLIMNPKEYPYCSMEFVRQNAISGNLATTFTWGSYAFWKLYPQCKVLIDGRYEEVYSDSVFRETTLFSMKQGAWPRVLHKYPPDVIIVPKWLYQPVDLQNIPDWDLAYQDFVSVVLLPKDKIRSDFINPDYKNPAYLKENYSRQIPLIRDGN
jgi:hypothetical protein